MKFHPVLIVWLLACISLVLCQDGVGTKNATKSSILSEVPKLRDFEVTTSQKPTSAVREEQIEDELTNDATTTEKSIEKRKFIVKPIKENEDYREVFTVRFGDTGPTTLRSITSSNRYKSSFSSTIKKYEQPQFVTDSDDVDFTTSYDGLTKKNPTENEDKKTRSRLDGFKGVTTNRGKTRFQNDPATSEIPEISTTIRYKKPNRIKPTDQSIKDDASSTSVVDDLSDTSTLINNPENEQQRSKFKKPPLIDTHHPNFGTSTEAYRRPIIRSNSNLKQIITSSIMKTRQPEPDVTEPISVPVINKTSDAISSNILLSKMRPIRVISSKASVTQQPIPPTATAWALTTLKAPNNTSRIFRKPQNSTNIQEQISKIKPFVTWSARLQKTNEEISNLTSTSNSSLVTESSEASTDVTPKHSLSSESSAPNKLTPEITSTESLIHIISTLSSTGNAPYGNDSTANIVGGDTDQNKYEVYGSQKPDVENATTVIETLRPLSSTTPVESQNSNLLLVTSYKSILENNNTSEASQNVFTSSEIPVSEITHKKFIKNDEFTAPTTDKSHLFGHSGETSSENIGDHTFPAVQNSTEVSSKTPELLFDYSEYHDSNRFPTTTTEDQSSSPNITFTFSPDIDLNNQSTQTTTEQYIDSIKTKLDGIITESIDNHDLLDIEDFTRMFSRKHPVSSSTIKTDAASEVPEKTTSELPLPSNDIWNTSQAPKWVNSPDTFPIDFESNSTEIHDDSGDDGPKNYEPSLQSSTVEPTSESDISENDVPATLSVLIPSSTSTTTSTTSTTTTTTQAPTTTTSTTTTTTTLKPTTLITTTRRPTTTTTTSRPTTTTTTTPRPTTTTLRPTTTTPRPTTTTSRPTTTTTQIPTTTSTTTTTQPTTIPQPTTTPQPKTTQRTTTTTFSPNVIDIATTSTTVSSSTISSSTISSIPNSAGVDTSVNETENSNVKAAMYLSCVAGICFVVVLILWAIRKRQKRFNYGQRCTPVSLDGYSLDNISMYNSVKRKGVLRASKISYGNPAFDDSTAVTHLLNFAELVSFSEDRPAIDAEFSNVPVVTVKPDELPPGVETKNRYANVIPLPETKVMLNPRPGQNSDYINANFVKGYKGAEKFYIACQAPMQSTLPDFWQMIWEQNTRVIIMVTNLTENGVERCADYLPPSEVLDCHRLFGDYQVTLKKREVKEKFIVSSLQIKNMESNLWRDVTHLWYAGWPAKGVPSDPAAVLSFLMEARSHMKTNSGPHVVHCSPGTGRTGTVIACDVALREFELSRAVDVPKTVYAVRRCRAGAVQTREQYALIYKVVALYASKLSGGVLDSI